VDLGGGTGNFTQALAEAARVRRRVLCVDAFAEMLQKVAQRVLAACAATCLTRYSRFRETVRRRDLFTGDLCLLLAPGRRRWSTTEWSRCCWMRWSL
jgi:hypothetical protein